MKPSTLAWSFCYFYSVVSSIAEGELVLYLEKKEEGLWESLYPHTSLNNLTEYMPVNNPFLILYLHSTNKLRVSLHTKHPIKEDSIFIHIQTHSSDPFHPTSSLEVRWKDSHTFCKQTIQIQAIVRNENAHCHMDVLLSSFKSPVFLHLF